MYKGLLDYVNAKNTTCRDNVVNGAMPLYGQPHPRGRHLNFPVAELLDQSSILTKSTSPGAYKRVLLR